MNSATVNEIIDHVEALPPNLQEQVLVYVRALDTSYRHGVPGRELLRFAGAIAKEDLAQMSQAIEEGCEQVDLNEW
ncbi:hypothetical protein GC175_14110 [bacterium]|nr:hypothetical protein [bacterium]